jgi:hypothetical protein
MALPKIDLPIFELDLPSTGKTIKYRPFTVKEEKILLVAQESNDATQELMAIKQVVNNCLVDEEAEQLAMFDLEYIMLILRSKSVDNMIEFQVTDPETDKIVELKLDIENVTLTTPDNAQTEVKVNDEYTLYLKYPTIDEYAKILVMDNEDPLVNYVLMVACMEKIASEDEVSHFKDYSEEDVAGFVDNLSADVIKGIQDFFENIPRLRHEMHYTNADGNDKTFVVEGMRSFFI